MGEITVFYLIATLVAICSLMVILGKNPVGSAVFLVMDLFLIACLYALMSAHFIAAIQVIVYAGAIMVLFVFVIMLLNMGNSETVGFARLSVVEIGVLFLTVAGFLVVAFQLSSGLPVDVVAGTESQAVELALGNTRAIGLRLFGTYVWPFELASVLILLAIVASVVIASKRPERSENRKKEASRGAA